MDIEGFNTSLSDVKYAYSFKARMNDRISFVTSRKIDKAGIDKLPDDALEALNNVINEIP